VRRRRALLLIGLFAASALVLAVLAVLLRHAAPLAADLAIERWLQQWRWPPLLGLMLVVSWLGYSPQSVAGTLALGVVAGLASRWRDGLWLAGTQIATVATSVVKTLVERPRPTPDLVQVYSAIDEYAFPSGHVVFYTTLFGFAFFLVYVHVRRRPWRAFLLALLLTPILLVGISRVYLGYHWPSDVLGGYALAVALLVPYGALYAHLYVPAPGPAAPGRGDRTPSPSPSPRGRGDVGVAPRRDT
jgi:undecaprenyl-diphosphatase